MARNKKSNLTIKILAVFIAGIMWIYVMGEVNPKITKEFNSVSVTLKNEDSVKQSNLYILEGKEVDVNIKITGRRNDVINISQDDINAYIDLRGATDGMNRFPIDISDLNKVEIESYYPKEALFNIDEVISKKVTVSINKSGKVASGYSSGEPIVKPVSVLIRGPRSKVNTVTTALATIELNGLTEDKTVNVPYKVLDDKGKEVSLIEKESDNVEIAIPVYKVKSVAIEPQIIGNPLKGFEITGINTDPKYIEVMGYKDKIEEIVSIKTKPIDVDFLSSDILTDIELVIPEGVKIVNKKENIKAEVKVEELITKTFEYTLKDMTFINLKEGLILNDTLSTGNIQITIKGIKSIIEDLSRRDITVYMDLKGLEIGNYEVEVNALKGEGIEIIDISPRTMEVSIKKVEENSQEGNNQEENNDTTDNNNE